jgi:quinol-cytochrome oxidoreductase complex cytochrome b subunit
LAAFLKRFPAKVASAFAIVAGAFALFLIVFALICTLSKPNVGGLPDDALAQQSTAADVGKNRRPLEDAYYSYPEWYIVWSYEERATYLEKGSLPSRFPSAKSRTAATNLISAIT